MGGSGSRSGSRGGSRRGSGEHAYSVAPAVVLPGESIAAAATAAAAAAGGGGGGAGVSGAADSDSDSDCDLPSAVAALKYRLRVSEAKLAAAETQLSQWRHAIGRVMNAVLLSPAMNELYRTRLSAILTSLLPQVPQIEKVMYVDCSFPSVTSNAPRLDLLRWHAKAEDGRMRGEFAADFRPQWTMDVGIEGRHYLVPFSLQVKVWGFQLCGRMAATFPPNMSTVGINFMSFPAMDMTIDVEVKWGVVQVPLIRQAIASLIRNFFKGWVQRNLVDRSMTLPCIRQGRKEGDGMDDEDLKKARQAAMEQAAMTSMKRGVLG